MRAAVSTFWRTVMLAALTASAAASPAPQAPGATVVVDFRAVTEDGQPVPDLKTTDVTLRVGGRPRTLKSLQLVRIGSGEAARGASKLPPPFATNTETTSGDPARREVLIVLDELSIAPGKEPPLRQSLAELVDALTPADRIGVVSTRQGGTSHPFTQDHGQVRSALARLSGYAPARLSDSDFACNAQLVVQTLRTAISEFGPTAAPILVFVSAAVAGPASDRMTQLGVESDLCLLRTNHFEAIGTAAHAAHANVYVVHALDAASSSQPPQVGQIGIDAIAGVTGGETIRIVGGERGARLARIATETSAYYVARFDADPGDRAGDALRVDVRVARDGVRVSARPHVAIPRAPAEARKRNTPRDLIRVAEAFTELPLRGAIYPSRNPDGRVRAVALFEADVPGIQLAAATVVAYDAKGTVTSQWTAQAGDLTSSPARAALLLQPGTFRIRIAATDQAGRGGTIDTELRAEAATDGAVETSALVLGVPAGGSFAPRLQFAGGDAQAIGYVEIYNVPAGSALNVTFELAETEGGPAIATGPAQIANGPTTGSRLAYGGFAIGPMAPGDLQMRAAITIDGKPIGRPSRTMRKVK